MTWSWVMVCLSDYKPYPDSIFFFSLPWFSPLLFKYIFAKVDDLQWSHIRLVLKEDALLLIYLGLLSQSHSFPHILILLSLCAHPTKLLPQEELCESAPHQWMESWAWAKLSQSCWWSRDGCLPLTHQRKTQYIEIEIQEDRLHNDDLEHLVPYRHFKNLPQIFF